MPACLAHYYFAQNVRESLEEKASLHLCAYAWGAQGPDFFFCHRFLPCLLYTSDAADEL